MKNLLHALSDTLNFMANIRILFFVAFWLIGIPAGAASLQLYVDPVKGDDGAAGTYSAPLKTIEAARDVASKLSHAKGSSVVVNLRDGVYYLKRTLLIDKRHAPPEGQEITFRSYPGERAVISGGKLLDKWSEGANGLFVADADGLFFRDLVVNGKWAYRASYPNVYQGEAWLKFASYAEGDPTGMKIYSSDFKRWQGLDRVEMVVNHYWMEWRVFPKDYLVDGKYVMPVIDSGGDVKLKYHYRRSYYWQNSLDFVDAPGEWYLDVETNRVYYKPRAGEEAVNLRAEVPILETLIKLDGVSGYNFVGMEFRTTGWTEPSVAKDLYTRAGCLRYPHPGERYPKDSHGQAIEYPLPGAVDIKSARNVRFEDDVFNHLAANAVVVREGVKNVSFVGNIFDYVGDSALCIGVQQEPFPSRVDKNDNIEISNNFITRVGNNYHSGAGIISFYPAHMRIVHNELVDIPGWGVNIGLDRYSVPVATSENLIAYNYFSNVTYWSSDSGVIHTKAKNSGKFHTKIQYNWFDRIIESNVAATARLRGVIFLDNESSGLRISENLMTNIHPTVYPFRFHSAGDDNLISKTVSDPSGLMSKAGLQQKYRTIRGRSSIKVASKGSGRGSVVSDPAGINCDGSCSASFDSRQTLLLTASPAAGSKFVGWAGDCESYSAEPKCFVTMSKARRAEALFVVEDDHRLAIKLPGQGVGKVSSKEFDIDCNVDCATYLKDGAVVRLSPITHKGAEFLGWFGDCSGQDDCVLEMNGDKTVSAIFLPQVSGMVNLFVYNSGTGAGRVSSNPEKLSCTDYCWTVFDLDSTIRLSATPDDCSSRAAWLGDCSMDADHCDLKFDASKIVGVEFNRESILCGPRKTGWRSLIQSK